MKERVLLDCLLTPKTLYDPILFLGHFAPDLFSFLICTLELLYENQRICEQTFKT